MPINLDDYAASLRPKSARRAAEDWLLSGTEPRLCDVLGDPLVHAVMRRDGVSQAQLRAVIARAQACLRGDPCCRCAA